MLDLDPLLLLRDRILAGGAVLRAPCWLPGPQVLDTTCTAAGGTEPRRLATDPSLPCDLFAPPTNDAQPRKESVVWLPAATPRDTTDDGRSKSGGVLLLSVLSRLISRPVVMSLARSKLERREGAPPPAPWTHSLKQTLGQASCRGSEEEEEGGARAARSETPTTSRSCTGRALANAVASICWESVLGGGARGGSRTRPRKLMLLRTRFMDLRLTRGGLFGRWLEEGLVSPLPLRWCPECAVSNPWDDDALPPVEVVAEDGGSTAARDCTSSST